MIAYILKRLLLMVPTLFGILLVEMKSRGSTSPTSPGSDRGSSERGSASFIEGSGS